MCSYCLHLALTQRAACNDREHPPDAPSAHNDFSSALFFLAFFFFVSPILPTFGVFSARPIIIFNHCTVSARAHTMERALITENTCHDICVIAIIVLVLAFVCYLFVLLLYLCCGHCCCRFCSLHIRVRVCVYFSKRH